MDNDEEMQRRIREAADRAADHARREANHYWTVAVIILAAIAFAASLR